MEPFITPPRTRNDQAETVAQTTPLQEASSVDAEALAYKAALRCPECRSSRVQYWEYCGCTVLGHCADCDHIEEL